MWQDGERINYREKTKTFRRIGIVIVILLLILLAIACFGFMDDEVIGRGTIEGIRVYELKTLVSSSSVKIYHYDGEFVKRGEVLIEFDSRDQQDKIVMLKHDLKQLQTNYVAKKRALELLKKDPLPSYYRNTALELTTAREKLRLAEREYEVYRDLYNRKLVTRKELLQVELSLLANRGEAQRLERDQSLLKDGMATEIIAKAEEELLQLEQKLTAKNDELQMAIRHLEDYVIKAPDAGVITDIPPRSGNYYEKGEVVVRFSANQYKRVIGLIPESQIFKVVSGQRVKISANQYNRLDYGYFWGTVNVIYQLPVKIENTKYYPVKIVLDNEKLPLRFGSDCEVTIITGRERIMAVLLGLKSENFIKRHAELLKEAYKPPQGNDSADKNNGIGK